MAPWLYTLILSLALMVTTPVTTTEKSPSLLLAKTQAEQLCNELSLCTNIETKNSLLLKNPDIQAALTLSPTLNAFLLNAPPKEKYALLLLISLGQFETLFQGFERLQNKEAALQKLAKKLVEIDSFYQPIGGLLGYHKTVISLMTEETLALDTTCYLPPPINDIRIKNTEVWASCYDGVLNVEKAATILALGGAGDRLNLIDEETKEPLPAACLPFCGKSLFEGLMRDIEAQEYWNYRAFGHQATMPVLIMTSEEKNNDHHIETMGNKAAWFGHSKMAIRRMVQPLVPIIDTDGKWAVSAPLEMTLKPGGHGVIWKLAQDSGSLAWLTSLNVQAAIVRQVNNPLAGLDHALFTMMGHGLTKKKSFGFLSCPSRPLYAEGLNVLLLKKSPTATLASISNIEYTQFGTLKALLPDLFKEGACPANTNILYVNLNDISKALANNPIPGMIVNAKTNIDVIKDGLHIKKNGGRLESCMQNLSDGLMSPINNESSNLPTFLLLQDREKLMSATKRAFQVGQSPQETPVSCLYDYNLATSILLSTNCHMNLPEKQSIEEFIQKGPSFIFTFHPALGPIWEVIGQKLSGGKIHAGSDIEFEIAEIACKDLAVNGSFKILARRPTGEIDPTLGRIFSNRVGRVRLSNVTIDNKGAAELDPTAILKGSVEHKESCEIILEGFSEVVAQNVTLFGNFRLIVPDGKRATISQDRAGHLHTTFEAISSPSWLYTVEWKRGEAPKLSLNEAA